MAKKKKDKANQRKATQSTDSLTGEKEGRTYEDALKATLSGPSYWIDEKDRDGFANFRLDMLGDLKPIGFWEEELVEEMIGLKWRFMRRQGLEVQALEENTLSEERIKILRMWERFNNGLTRRYEELLRELGSSQRLRRKAKKTSK